MNSFQNKLTSKLCSVALTSLHDERTKTWLHVFSFRPALQKNCLWFFFEHPCLFSCWLLWLWRLACLKNYRGLVKAKGLIAAMSWQCHVNYRHSVCIAPTIKRIAFILKVAASKMRDDYTFMSQNLFRRRKNLEMSLDFNFVVYSNQPFKAEVLMLQHWKEKSSCNLFRFEL